MRDPSKEFGAGWDPLVDTLLKRLAILGGTFSYAKEKFGGLRFGYHEGDASESDWEKFSEMVDETEQQSYHVCELCGKPGRLMSKGGWLKTVCPEHAQSLGYKDKA